MTAMSAYDDIPEQSPPARKAETVTFELRNVDGKRWHIKGVFEDGRSFALQPVGEISAHEAEVVCRGVLNAAKVGARTV